MKSIRKHWALLLLLALAVFSISALFVLTREKPEEIAAKVAKEWVNSGIEQTSETLAKAATGGKPVLQQVATSIIKNQVQQKISWTYSKPRKVDTDRYEVVATARAPITVRVLNAEMTYDLSGDFILIVDTKEKKVDNWKLDLGSFGFAQR